jgi:pimeloyl-ACP methyl ester carboxylesterase
MRTDAGLLDGTPAESQWIETGGEDGVRLHTVTAGDPDDPPVVLLHGFPDFWYGWREQIPELVDAGYYVLAPDQRGYNRSDAPESVRSYRVDRLSADVADVIRSTGRESAHVVGHDWGAGVAWDLALRRPQLVDRLGILNVPHPSVFVETLRRRPRQLLRSWYMFALQLPRLPEWWLARDDCAALLTALETTSHEGAFSPDDLERYRAAHRHDGAVRGMINWYRAAARYGLSPPREEVPVPTVILWGEADDALLPEMAPASLDRCPDGRLELFPDASHWVHLEATDRVTAEIVAHLDGV